ncbi:hypothetical protein Tco_1307857 [Tanacetum coccineum]
MYGANGGVLRRSQALAGKLGVGVNVFHEVYIEVQITQGSIFADGVVIQNKKQATTYTTLAEATLAEVPDLLSVSDATVVDASHMVSSGVASATVVDV